MVIPTGPARPPLQDPATTIFWHGSWHQLVVTVMMTMETYTLAPPIFAVMVSIRIAMERIILANQRLPIPLKISKMEIADSMKMTTFIYQTSASYFAGVDRPGENLRVSGQ
jgi:hypothetical protein